MCHQVASSAAIELGDDDDPALVEAMLRIIYDDEDGCIMRVTIGYSDFLEALLDLYVLGDKYDVPVLRHQAKDQIMSNIRSIVNVPRDLRGEKQSWVDEMIEQAAKCIMKVLGPSCITFADKSIQEETLEWCAETLNDLLWHRTFRKLLGKGRLFSADFAGRLFLMKARHDGVEFGLDVDSDVYEHSSECSDGNDDEQEGESEAEEEDSSVANVSIPD